MDARIVELADPTTKEFIEFLGNAVRQLFRLRSVLDRTRHDGKFIAAEARDQGLPATGVDNPRGGFGEHDIARRVAEDVVDRFEVVEVHHDHAVGGAAGEIG